MRISLSFLFVLLFAFPGKSQTDVSKMEKQSGFFDFYYDESTGKVWLEVEDLEQEFLYVNSLSQGVGSNDIGLDRGQLGGERVVKFQKMGDKLLLIQPNLRYRAVTDNELERRSVEEAFAKSVIAGFKFEQKGNNYLIDLTPFIMQDAHGVANTLQRGDQGNFSVDESRSAVNLKRTKNFPKNTEFDVLLTFKGSKPGGYLRSVTPTPTSLTVFQHHSFVELPDDNYEVRRFDPRAGYFALGYFDYAKPIEENIEQKLIYRHRLEKKNPNLEKSEAKEPIIYYLDPGTPEPVRSALLDGARWWNQAFEAAGYIDAFQVKMLPADADPMDVRYNVIQWVHRSTRGWSYGGSVSDPRTGEIIKGHVSLGSLRVRQDLLIAQGLASLFKEGEEDVTELKEMALARIRQLSAHEVGHTIGLAHNFAASTNDRASVMDYPHPYVTFNSPVATSPPPPVFSEAYATGIGDWDKRAVLYGYADFPRNTDVEEALHKIVLENEQQGLLFISDEAARPQGGVHPSAHLWDNGNSATEELKRIMDVRNTAMSGFGISSIPTGTSLADLEDVFVPLYLSHRYQVEAAAKLIGGIDYKYAVRDGSETPTKMVPIQAQSEALHALTQTLQPEFLEVPESIIALIPPKPIGSGRGRENFKSHTGPSFDPLGAAEASANHTFTLLMHPQRLSRIIEQHARDQSYHGLERYFDAIARDLPKSTSGMDGEISRIVEKLFVLHLLNTAANDRGNKQVVGHALSQIEKITAAINSSSTQGQEQQAHQLYLKGLIHRFKEDPKEFKLPEIPALPAGSPIGCDHTLF